jgi:uncharacterized protein YciI
MQYLIIAYDGTDEKALERRLAVREEHLALVKEMRAAGNVLFAAVILDDDEKMIGSALTCEFSTRQELDDWLDKEPYVLGKVWEKIDIKPCKVAPMFLSHRA